MKKVFVAVLMTTVLLLSGCIIIETETAAVNSYEDNTADDVLQSEYNTLPPETTEQETESETAAESSSAEEITSAEPSESLGEITEVDLSIEMPEKNGTMHTSASAENKYIKAVSSDRDIETDRLVAVYAVPESGQNYVFEFYDSDDRSKDDLRRVYLLDSKCRITGVAATDAKEKESISTVENWFCMNVLIKEVIFPAVEDSFR